MSKPYRVLLVDPDGTVIETWEVERERADDGSCEYWIGTPESEDIERALDRTLR
jgi:hypothetical protein